MNYWLMKSEPDSFSIDALYNRPNQTEHWDGVRNYQARNMMRDEMKLGDLIFFYHSNCDVPGIVGIMEIVKESYPDFTAFDPEDQHYDPRSDPEDPRWIMVDVRTRSGVKNEGLNRNRQDDRPTRLVRETSMRVRGVCGRRVFPADRVRRER